MAFTLVGQSQLRKGTTERQRHSPQRYFQRFRNFAIAQTFRSQEEAAPIQFRQAVDDTLEAMLPLSVVDLLFRIGTGVQVLVREVPFREMKRTAVQPHSLFQRQVVPYPKDPSPEIRS